MATDGEIGGIRIGELEDMIEALSRMHHGDREIRENTEKWEGLTGKFNVCLITVLKGKDGKRQR